jgi:hypothetical protein
MLAADPIGGPMPADTDEYLKKFVDFLGTQDVGRDLTYDDIAQARTRDELGISSLNIILVVANYIKEQAGGEVTFKPEWVAKLDDVDGILSVMREIDESRLEEASAK